MPTSVHVSMSTSVHVSMSTSVHASCPHRSKLPPGVVADEQLDGSLTVLDVKALLAEICDIAPNAQRFIYKGKVLKDGLTLDDAGADTRSQAHAQAPTLARSHARTLPHVRTHAHIRSSTRCCAHAHTHGTLRKSTARVAIATFVTAQESSTAPSST
eukprot:4094961-Pleurochrysis_carterae.AAC.1